MTQGIICGLAPPTNDAQGGGSANKTSLFQQTKALLNPAALTKFVEEKIKGLGTAACPPYHLAFVIGGTSAEYNLKVCIGLQRHLMQWGLESFGGGNFVWHAGMGGDSSLRLGPEYASSVYLVQLFQY